MILNESYAAYLKGGFSLGLNGHKLGVSSGRPLMDITGISMQSSKEKMVNLGRNLQEIRTIG